MVSPDQPQETRAGAERSLAVRFRRHAAALVRDARSPLCVALMLGAAEDLEADGPVARLFTDVPALPGSVPQLRLLAALHHLVLSGQAPELAAFYPSVGGGRPPEGAWAAAAATIERRFDWIRDRLYLTVQTNEPGRSTVLYPALLWLTERHRLPIRLLELGASAGLNLIPERYCYLVGPEVLGDASSAVRFAEPLGPGPPVDLRAAARAMRISRRAGCDRHPLNPADPDDRLSLLSYIWPDEMPRIARMRGALEIAARFAPAVEQSPAGEWLGRALGDRRPGELAVIWHSVFRQYVAPEEWEEIESAIRRAGSSEPGCPTVWLSMEPGHDHLRRMKLTVLEAGDAEPRVLAECGDHGPPVRWLG
jgi:hypothetical protein